MALAFQQRIYWRRNDIVRAKWKSGRGMLLEGYAIPTVAVRAAGMLLEGYGHSHSGGEKCIRTLVRIYFFPN